MAITDKLTAIANAIRSKTGESGTMTMAQMPSKIAGINTKENVTWHQCPAAVKSYLDNVTYNSSDYSTSQIADYAPATAVSSNTKPVGNTVGGVTYYNEVPNTDTPFGSSDTAGTLRPLDSLRWIGSVTANMRDLGGWACDGGTVKYGMLYRGAIPNASDKALISSLGIKAELDIRGQEEAQQTESFWDIDYFCTENYISYSVTGVPTWKEMLRCVFDNMAHNKPVFFHCTYGADRTGTLACILEGVLGVSQSDCDKDYELTTFSTGSDTDAHARRRNEAEWQNLINGINTFSGATFRDKCVNFVASCGFTAAEINAFRTSMIDGTPSAVSPSITSYTVTNSLTNATSDGASSIQQNKIYEARISPAAGCTLESVTVSMGGTDITASSVKTVINGATAKSAGNHYIDIKTARATGNISITASAVTGSRLPSEYQEVEWIGSSGSQCIQILFNSALVGAYIEQEIMRTDSGVRGLIGSANTGAATVGAAAGSYFGWNTSGYWEMGGSAVSEIMSSTSEFDKVKFEWTAAGSGKLTVNGVAAAQRSGSGAYTKFNIFGGSSYPVSCRQKEISVHNVSGGTTETAHLVPCYRKSDGTVGMYDIIGAAFCQNIGTGAFSKGADVD